MHPYTTCRPGQGQGDARVPYAEDPVGKAVLYISRLLAANRLASTTADASRRLWKVHTTATAFLRSLQTKKLSPGDRARILVEHVHALDADGSVLGAEDLFLENDRFLKRILQESGLIADLYPSLKRKLLARCLDAEKLALVAQARRGANAPLDQGVMERLEKALMNDPDVDAYMRTHMAFREDGYVYTTSCATSGEGPTTCEAVDLATRAMIIAGLPEDQRSGLPMLGVAPPFDQEMAMRRVAHRRVNPLGVTKRGKKPCVTKCEVANVKGVKKCKIETNFLWRWLGWDTEVCTVE